MREKGGLFLYFCDPVSVSCFDTECLTALRDSYLWQRKRVSVCTNLLECGMQRSRRKKGIGRQRHHVLMKETLWGQK